MLPKWYKVKFFVKLCLMMFTRQECWWFCLRWAGYLGRYRSQVPQEGPGNASRGLLFSEGRGHSAVTSCQLQQVNVIHHAPVNEQNIDMFAKLFSRHPSISKLYLLVFYLWTNDINWFSLLKKWNFLLLAFKLLVIYSELWNWYDTFGGSRNFFFFGGGSFFSNNFQYFYFFTHFYLFKFYFDFVVVCVCVREGGRWNGLGVQTCKGSLSVLYHYKFQGKNENDR